MILRQSASNNNIARVYYQCSVWFYSFLDINTARARLKALYVYA